MFLMFALFVVSLCALLWAAIAVGRHVRRDKRQQRSTGLTPSAGPAIAEAIELEQGTLKLEHLEPASPLSPSGSDPRAQVAPAGGTEVK